MSDDIRFMRRAIELAKQGEGGAEPNPMVGCVIVQNGEIVAEGFHAEYGGDHAEVAALKNLDDSCAECDLYVTLEPCCHTGKTPPCSNTIIADQRIRRVVVGLQDPFGEVDGGGIAQLKNAGIDVTVGVCHEEVEELNAPYLKLIRDERPWVIAKWAMTLDGKIATAERSSQWISNQRSRKVVHALRARVDAIIVGSGTALADDPMLTARPPGKRQPARVVLDRSCQLPTTHQLVQTAKETPTWLFTGLNVATEALKKFREMGVEVFPVLTGDRTTDVSLMLRELAQKRLTNVLVEGGSELIGSLFDARLIDEVVVFIAPKLAGGVAALTPIGGEGVAQMSESLHLKNPTIEVLGGDTLIRGRVS